MKNKFFEKVDKFFEEYSKEALIVSIIVLLIIFFYKFIIYTLIIASIITYFLKDYVDRENARLEAERQRIIDETENFCYSTLFSIFYENFRVFSILKPQILAEIVPFSYKKQVNGITKYKACVIKDNSVSSVHTTLLKYKLISLIENKFKTFANPSLYYKENLTKLQILDIEEDDVHLFIEFVLVNDENTYNFYISNENRKKVHFQKSTVTSTQKSKNNDGVPICYDEQIHKFNVNESIKRWDYTKFAHMLVIGSTGSGKTCFNLILLRTLLDPSFNQKSTVYIADYKGEDFEFLHNYGNYFKYSDCAIAIDRLYQIMKDRQSGFDESRKPYFLLFDEMGAFILSLNKKEADEYKNKIGEILMLGRSLGIHLIISLQRPDSTYFASGARENLQNSCVVCLGNQSKEATSMLFSDFKDEISKNRKQGTGYLLSGGYDFSAIKTKYIDDIEKLKSDILSFIK